MTYQDFRIVPVRFWGGPLNGDLNELDYAEHELQEMLDRDEPWDFTSGHPERGPGRHDRAVPARAPARRPVGVRACRTFERPAGERNFTAVFSGGCATGSLRWRTTPRLRILFQLRDRHAGAW